MRIYEKGSFERSLRKGTKAFKTMQANKRYKDFVKSPAVSKSVGLSKAAIKRSLLGATAAAGLAIGTVYGNHVNKTKRELKQTMKQADDLIKVIRSRRKK